MVLVERMDPGKVIGYCSGFLLSDWIVMTAAHCEAKSYQVYVGLHNINKLKGVQIIQVDQTFPEIDYIKANFTHDVMLLKLKVKVEFNAKVKPIDLADPNDQPPQECMVFGWGHFKPNSTDLSPFLKEANVTITTADCEKTFYCSKGRSGPGKGDSGSPLVCENGKVYGVMSHGRGPDQNGERSCRYSMVANKV